MALAAMWLLRAGAPAGAQPVRQVPEPSPPAAPAAAPAPAAESPTDAPPVSVERVREGLARAPEPVIKMPRPPDFTVDVEGQLPRIEAFITNEALKQGPSMPAAVTHQEFLSMVTPQEARPFGAFSPTELATVAATSLGFAYAASVLPGVMKQAWRDRQMAAARKEVAAVVAELERQARDRAAAQAGPAADPPPSAPPRR